MFGYAPGDSEPAIFLARQAGPNDSTGTWSTNSDVDHIFFDDILAQVKQSQCVDTTRVFAIGFSLGGMLTWSLSVNHQNDIRAAFGEFFCYDFEGCKPGYPTKACTFDGGHVSTDFEPWIAEEAWKFFKQF